MTWELVAGIISLIGMAITYLLKQSDAKKLSQMIVTLELRNKELESALLKKNKYVHELEKVLIARDTPAELAERLNGLFQDSNSGKAGSV